MHQDVFIIGSKGIPAKYGGFETFVEFLTKGKVSPKINYHVSCMGKDNSEFFHNDARCFNVKVPEIGSAKAVLYDLLALNATLSYIKEKNIDDPIIYILACRIGPFMFYYKNLFKKLNVRLLINPDGHEWKRSKWNNFIKRYWKLSEKLMVKSASLLVCDSRGIEEYINNEYSKYNPQTEFIAYGADVVESPLTEDDPKLVEWLSKNKLKKDGFYLIVGRFVPENNYELMIKEFMKSTTEKDLAIITNTEGNDFYNTLIKSTNFKGDKRIKFVGTVYDNNLIKKIREYAYGYIHGHEVGGTNPSLLEALASTKLNVLLNVNFNREVGQSSSFYFDKEKGDLAKILNDLENISKEDINKYSDFAKKRILEHYSWNQIVEDYEKLFLRKGVI